MEMLRRCVAAHATNWRRWVPWLPGIPGHPATLLIALRIRIRFHQLSRFVDQVILAILAGAADPRLAPEMMILVDADVAFRRALELDAGRGSRDLVDVEAARLLDRELP